MEGPPDSWMPDPETQRNPFDLLLALLVWKTVLSCLFLSVPASSSGQLSGSHALCSRHLETDSFISFPKLWERTWIWGIVFECPHLSNSLGPGLLAFCTHTAVPAFLGQ